MTASFSTPTSVLISPSGKFRPFQEQRRYPTESNPGSMESDRDIWLVRASTAGEDLDYRKVAASATPADIEAASRQLFPQTLQALIQGLAPGVPVASASLLQVTQSTGGHVWFLWSVPTATGMTFVGALYDGTTFTELTYGSIGAGEDTLGASIAALDNGSVVISYVLRTDSGGASGGTVRYLVTDPVSAITGPGTFVRLGGSSYLVPSPDHPGVLPADLIFGGFAIAQRPNTSWYMSWGAHDGITTSWYIAEGASITDLTTAAVHPVMALPEVASLQESGSHHLLGEDHVWEGHDPENALLAASTRGIERWTPLLLGAGTSPHTALVDTELPRTIGTYTITDSDPVEAARMGLFFGTTASFPAAAEPKGDPCVTQSVPSTYTSGQSSFHRGKVPWKGNVLERCP